MIEIVVLYVTINLSRNITHLSKEIKMRKLLERIAISNPDERCNSITSILKEFNCPYKIVSQNIVVSLNEGYPRLIIGVQDNSAGICILIETIKKLLAFAPKLPIDIIFFDFKENKGSKTYAKNINKKEILAMINLDICDVGDTIAISPVKNVNNGLLNKALVDSELLYSDDFKILSLPCPSADLSFEEAGIPSISITTLTYNDTDNASPSSLERILDFLLRIISSIEATCSA
jgi:Predicted aminopeptidases